MNLSELEALNHATLQALRQFPGAVDFWTHPYFGYYTVDIFDCPPFLMFTNHDCLRAMDILYARKFEPGSMKVWCRLARTASGIIDIGAQVGVYALAAAALRQDVTIHAFEPNPHAIARLRVHCRANRFENIVEHNLAVGHDCGSISFGWLKKPGLPISSGGQLGSHEQLGDRIERTVVNMTTLDAAKVSADLGAHGLMKIDVEGAEQLVFQGMSETLKQRPDIILESFNQRHCDYINGVLLPLGYHSYLIQEGSGKLVPQDSLRPCRTDSEDYNQFLTVKSPTEIAAILG